MWRSWRAAARRSTRRWRRSARRAKGKVVGHAGRRRQRRRHRARLRRGDARRSARSTSSSTTPAPRATARSKSSPTNILQHDFDQKLFAAIRLIRLVWPQMKERRWGRIINVLNIGAKAPRADSMPTSLSRAAGMALTKVLSHEGAPAQHPGQCHAGRLHRGRPARAGGEEGRRCAQGLLQPRAPRRSRSAASARPRNSPTSPASSPPMPAPTSPAPPPTSTAAARPWFRANHRRKAHLPPAFDV